MDIVTIGSREWPRASPLPAVMGRERLDDPDPIVVVPPVLETCQNSCERRYRSDVHGPGRHPRACPNVSHATSNPVWIDMPGGAQHASDAAAHFAAWLDRVIVADARSDFYNAAEKSATLDYLRASRHIYFGRQKDN